ncbi:hypothetical protein [Modicisalibacter tunisiensis]|uniref:PDZ domain-containing protein n=1 Tax=Modicisalibacter tunisiensis TaxID=390637 RepID=A0ABS7WVK4_9GAMM|nr:hypothetical protein [Modicisalibacter tunisiensis]MBZ9566626.1 hypothetical protein [Modicisalibacter tunisiensis]
MLARKVRQRAVVACWSFTLLLIPGAMAVVMRFNPAVYAGLPLSRREFVAVMLAFFVMAFIGIAFLCSKLNEDLDTVMQENDAESDDAFSRKSRGRKPIKDIDLLADDQDVGLRILRMAQGSPLRGKVPEWAVIRTLNGGMPSTAAEANSLVKSGSNQMEWVNPRGEVNVAVFQSGGPDLKIQVQQIRRPAARA